MLDRGDVLELPAGVRLADGVLVDEVRRTAVPVNPAAAVVLDGVGLALADATRRLATAFALQDARAADDVLSFAWELNRLGLVNVRRRAGRLATALGWARLTLRLLPAATVPPTLLRRTPIDTRSARTAVADVVRGLWLRAGLVGLAASALVLPAGSATGGPQLLPAASLGAGVALGLVLHEAGHAVALVRASPAALLVGWRRISVLHAPLSSRRRQLVAAAGPLGTAGAGLGLAVAAAAAGIPELALGATPVAAHALGLTALSTDGRKACGT